MDILSLLLTLCAWAPAAPADVLPDPLRFNDGRKVESQEDWSRRREEIVALLQDIEYGHMPPSPDNLKVEEVTEEPALDGLATRRRLVLSMGPENKVRMHVGLYMPNGKPGRLPVILAVEPVWIPELEPVAKQVVQAGYIFAGFERHDLDADNADRSDGVHPLYPDYDWASLAVWAWGSMRVMDYLVTLDDVDATKIAVTGHSRAGKVALLAGGLDKRFALVAPHASGAGGAGSFKILGKDPETLELITDPKRFHYWFSPKLREFAGKVDQLPFDQHFLIALVAPRAFLSVQGLDDLWANPLGTQQMFVAAQPVFDFVGAPEKSAAWFRPGGHDTTAEDWDVLIEYADHVFFDKPLHRDFRSLPFADAPAPTFAGE